jgi:hypothetical protein
MILPVSTFCLLLSFVNALPFCLVIITFVFVFGFAIVLSFRFVVAIALAMLTKPFALPV